jgi:hypothetical protein
MKSYKTLAIVTGCLFVIIIGACLCINRETPLPEPPESIDKAYARIASAGLFASGMPAAGLAGKRAFLSFTVSKKPMTDEKANSLHLGRSQDDWKGKARIYANGGEFAPLVRVDAPNYLTVVKGCNC